MLASALIIVGGVTALLAFLDGFILSSSQKKQINDQFFIVWNAFDDATALGLANAKARGVKFGRKPKLTEHQRKEAIKRLEEGRREDARDIAQGYNVWHQTISRLLALIDKISKSLGLHLD